MQQALNAAFAYLWSTEIHHRFLIGTHQSQQKNKCGDQSPALHFWKRRFRTCNDIFSFSRRFRAGTLNSTRDCVPPVHRPCPRFPPPPSPPRMDAYGDRLPAGAVARFRRRFRWRCPDVPKHLLWSPDGKFPRHHASRELLITIWAYPSGIVTGRFDAPDLCFAKHGRHSSVAQSDSHNRAGADSIRPRQPLDARLRGATTSSIRVHLPDARWERSEYRRTCRRRPSPSRRTAAGAHGNSV